MTRVNPTIKDLVQGFAKNIQELKAAQYKESSLRLQYLDPFWELLGWDVSNDQQRPLLDAEVVIEPSIDTAEREGLRSRKPDYLFRINGYSRFIVEAKKPAVDVATDEEAIFQAKQYAWNATIPFAVLTDFEQFRLFDTTLKPILKEPSRGLVQEFALEFQDYPAKWEEIAATFGRDAVADGSLERLRAKIRKVPKGRRLRTVDRMLIDLRGDEPVDRVFLDYLEKYRQHFAKAIYADNKQDFPEASTQHGAARLTEAVQRLIDRLVFMRVCEDRGVSRYGKLKETLDRISGEGGDFYKSLIAEFRQLDHEYNGYLFKFHFSETLTVSDDILADFVRTLYAPDGPWDFAVIGDDILGIVYERFLGNIVTVKHGHAAVEEKPAVRHAGGVYYTPRFIVDTIIRRVVGPQIKDKTPAELLDVKILDPACGSGSFLVAAFQYLIDHALTAVSADPSLATVAATPRARKKRRDIAFKDRQGVWHLAPDFMASLLTGCIHGVDIDQQAVEVTVMSLYLKMLEGKLPPNWQKDWLENELLPALDNNIQCGNSLINSADFDRYVLDTQGGLFPPDEDVRFRMNRFDWDSRTRGFGRLLDSQAVSQRGRAGFDCIIGNPPYIRVQELNEWAPDECEFYKWRYKSAQKGNYDIYVVFAERCLELLAPDGLLGFIMPHKFWQAKYGEGLRELIANGKHLRSVVDFGDQQVFRGPTTYTAIHVLGKRANPSTVNFAKVVELSDGEAQCQSLDSGGAKVGIQTFRALAPTGFNAWSFLRIADRKLMQRLLALGKPLGEVASIFVGLQTSNDRVYCLERVDDASGRVVIVRDRDGRRWELESKIAKPFLYDVTVDRFDRPIARHVLIFPYRFSGSKAKLISVDEMSKHFPLAWKYLEHHERRLRGRESGKADNDSWYGFIYRKNLSLFDAPKLIVPVISIRARFGYDDEGLYFTGGGNGPYYGVRWTDESQSPSLFYLQGLLNSRLLDAFLKTVSSPFHGGYWSYGKRFIEQIPIKLPSTKSDNKLADRVVESVGGIMAAKTKLRDAKLSDRERKTLEGDVENLERRIDDAVFELYGVDGLPD